ncbi:hypothetical protein BTA51_02060 [Hahella sp. CCB-MM4]|uniref:GDYXXLXY domain-containing protein n=1 Tax=Hahella sp. (strain CCB-MM4) TaxID=1926491 RepID=UPI000B9ABDC4|nr:GDYXXLXY domain-containing protein [Hahella sp. CCB-MM4]OZG75193.1 hypothetical protein BTA51_02060 [Hahella sp. CCB-MM4]
MMTRIRILWATLLAILVLVNFLVFQKERILSTGSTVLLELAPRDPRSLLQGDYMSLRYRLARDIGRQLDTSITQDGYAVVTLDQNQVAQLQRITTDFPDLSQNEHALLFRVRGSLVKLASDAYFFEEGTGRELSDAKYGELKVNHQGKSVITGLRDSEFKPLDQQLLINKSHEELQK